MAAARGGGKRGRRRRLPPADTGNNREITVPCDGAVGRDALFLATPFATRGT